MDYYTRFSEDLNLRGYANRTREAYRQALRKLEIYVGKNLVEISEEEVRKYWLYCKDELHWRPASMRISYSGIKNFYTFTVKREWPLFSEVKFVREATLPVVLSVDEVRTILHAMPPGQNRTFYEVVYSLGLRLTEATTLQVRDIDSSRMLVHIHAGKGAKDRLVPLPPTTLLSMRQYWKSHKNPKWLFPALGRSGKEGARTLTPVCAGTVQGALRRTVKHLRMQKHIHPHTFRHSYATHLIEAGVPVRHVQEYLGHETMASTMIYLHLTTAGKQESRVRIEKLMGGVAP